MKNKMRFETVPIPRPFRMALPLTGNAACEPGKTKTRSTGRQVRGSGEFFRPNQQALLTGIYRVIHKRHRSDVTELLLSAGDLFPECSRCSEPLFQLVRSAPYVFNDDDFSDDKICQASLLKVRG